MKQQLAATHLKSLRRHKAASGADRFDYVEDGEGLPEQHTKPQLVAQKRAMAEAPSGREERMAGARVVVVLEHAALELATGAGTSVLEGENELLVVHQCLICLLDSPLCKSGKLLIYLHSAKGLLVEVEPSLRLPRSFPQFAAMMSALLAHGIIRSQRAEAPLMRKVDGPAEAHLPARSRRIGVSASGRLVTLRDYASAAHEEAQGQDAPVVFSILASDGAAGWPAAPGYVDDHVSLCAWGVRAACACAKVCHEFEFLEAVC